MDVSYINFLVVALQSLARGVGRSSRLTGRRAAQRKKGRGNRRGVFANYEIVIKWMDYANGRGRVRDVENAGSGREVQGGGCPLINGEEMSHLPIARMCSVSRKTYTYIVYSISTTIVYSIYTYRIYTRCMYT